jgi:hypothetical protein
MGAVDRVVDQVLRYGAFSVWFKGEGRFEAMRNLTLLLAVLALYGLMLIFGANVLAGQTYNATVLDCGEDHDDDGDESSRTFDCGEDHEDDGDDAGRVLDCDDDDEDGDDASRTFDCGDDEDDSDDAGRVLDCGEEHEEDGDDAGRVLDCGEEHEDDAS